MTNAPQIFDRKLLKQRRRKALSYESTQKLDYLIRDVAEDISERVTLIKRDFPLVLDYGCHNGALGHQLSGLKTIGTVLSSDHALKDKRIIKSLPGSFVMADEELFPFATESFDLIVSALSLQWVNDLPGTLIQIRRGLKPDGVFIAATLGGDTLNELRHVLMMAEDELYGGVSARVAPFADVRDFGHLLQRAGFTLPVTDRDVRRVRYGSAFQLMKELQMMGASNMLDERRRDPISRRFLERVESLYQEHYGDADGRITASFEFIYLIGWAPHPDQPKPLRPGSGKVSLTTVFKGAEDKG